MTITARLTIDSAVAKATWGRGHDVGCREKRMILRDGRLGFKHIDARTGNFSGVQGRSQRLGIDDGAARGIDQNGGRLH